MPQKEIYPEGSAILAPLAGHSDLPMRLSAQRFGCRFAFAEMIDAGSLVFRTKKTLRLIERAPSEDWLGVQIVGSEPDTIRRAVEILNPMAYSVIDFNLGCPAPKVVRKGEGAALALRPDEALRAFEALAKTSESPATVKMRILSESDPAPTVSLAKRLQDAGAQAMTIHGRVMKAFYSGPVFHQMIKAVKEALEIPVVANGGAMDAGKFHSLLQESACPCGMVARGALGNPWIFREISNPACPPPSVAELADEMEAHIESMIQFYGEEMALRAGRKVLLEYLRGRGFPGTLRASASFVASRDDFKRFMEEVRRGPSPRFWSFLESNPDAERRLSPDH